MTLKQLQSKLKKLRTEAVQVVNDSTVEAAQQVLRDMRRRIFQEGKAVDASKIGEYSTRGFLAPVDKFIRKSAVRKLGPPRKKGGEEVVYVPFGYAQFRTLNGLRIDTVDLEYTGDLRRSLKVEKRGKLVSIVVVGPDNQKKIKENEDHFNKTIFEASMREREKAQQIFNENLTQFVKRILR